jgi:hypothetical protein
MAFPLVFSIYLIIVASAAALISKVWLTPRAFLLTIAFLVGWLAFAATLGATGVVGRYELVPPGMVLLVGPVVMTLLLLTLTTPGAVLAGSIPLSLLLGFQVFRLGVELSLHRLWSMGLAPRMMILEGGNIEILIAATAPVAAWLSTRGNVGRRVAWWWNLVGILSLANIVVRAVLTAPGSLHLIHAEVPDVAIITFPFTFIPGFMAPLALTLHLLAFRAFSTNHGFSSRT